jgi:hypothetical protein
MSTPMLLNPVRPHPALTLRRKTVPGTVTVIAAALVLASTGPAVAQDGPSGRPDTYVTSWDATAMQATVAAGFGPAPAYMVFAYAGIAVYDASVAVLGGGDPFAVEVQAPPGASAEAAVSAAAYQVLLHHFPLQAEAVLDPAYEASLASIPDGAAEDAGVTVGEQVAAALIELREDDGFLDPDPYEPPAPPLTQTWVPTPPPPPASPLPQGVFLADMKPFALRTADQLRPDGPPALTSRRYAREYAEVQRLGSATSTVRTAEQTEAARFWGEAPAPQARGAFRAFVDERDLDLADAARFMAMMSISLADAFIACFDAKYHYTFWRPVTAIRAGDADGNRRTVGDPTWTPLLANPNHPEYPSAHSCLTPAAAVVLSRFLHSRRIDYTMPSIVFPDDPTRARHFSTSRELKQEVANARVWGGIHFRSAVEDGANLAERAARYVLRHDFGQ